MSVAIIGYGWVGKAYHKMFPDAVIYDEPQNYYALVGEDGQNTYLLDQDLESRKKVGREIVNNCDMAIVCVPTPPKTSRVVDAGMDFVMTHTELDVSIVEEVVTWLETPLILIKSALQPGTVDKLVKKTGKKIAVSVEMVGEGNYFTPFWKYPDTQDPTMHSFLIVGGEEETARRCADVLWSKMSPDVDIHLVSAVEAEICKLMENAWGGVKVTFANVMYDVCEKLGANYTKVLQAWGADGRTEKMHMRVVPGKRGWGGKCYSKDIPALAGLDYSGFMGAVVKANEQHRAKDNG